MQARSLELRSVFGAGGNDHGVEASAQKEETPDEAEITNGFLPTPRKPE